MCQRKCRHDRDGLDERIMSTRSGTAVVECSLVTAHCAGSPEIIATYWLAFRTPLRNPAERQLAFLRGAASPYTDVRNNLCRPCGGEERTPPQYRWSFVCLCAPGGTQMRTNRRGLYQVDTATSGEPADYAMPSFRSALRGSTKLVRGHVGTSDDQALIPRRCTPRTAVRTHA